MRDSTVNKLDRRTVLTAGTVGFFGSLGLLQSSPVTAQSADATATIVLDDQNSDGQSITIDRVSSNVDARIRISENTPGENETYGYVSIEAGTSKEDFTVQLSTPIPTSQPIIAQVYPKSGGEDLAKSRAFVTITEDGQESDQYGIHFVEDKPDKGFNYPYYLFVPSPGEAKTVPMLVEPNNTGTTSDDFQVHKERARHVVRASPGAETSRALSVPFLVPVFPRPRSDPVDHLHYTHALDRKTLSLDRGPLERIDLQLLAMVEDAKDCLSDTPYSFTDQIMLNGFSASGNFVDRFAVLHAEKVLSVTAGGLNGMALLPLEEAKGQELRYHVGISDIEELIGKQVDLDALDEVNQLLYMGEEDTNDTIPYDGPWSDEDLRQTAVEVYGEDMIRDRFPFCYRAYDEAGISAQFKIYEGAGHTTRPALEDIIEFHRRSMQGESVEQFGEVLGTEPDFEVNSSEKSVGAEIEFSASTTQSGMGTIVAYNWKFDDGATATGERVTHEYDSPGDYEVTLKIIDDSGSEFVKSKSVSISGDGGSQESATENGGEESETADVASQTATAHTESATEVPGLGIGSAVSGVGMVTVGYLLKTIRQE